MRILVLGSGAREHAILLALKGEGGHQLFAAPGNAGIAADATLVPGLDANDPGAVTDYANDETIDLVIIIFMIIIVIIVLPGILGFIFFLSLQSLFFF